MELKIKLKPEKASEMRKVILDEFHCPSEGYWDGSANVAEGVYEYTTGTGHGHYALSEDNTLIYIGYRNSFLSGTMLFSIEKEDVEDWGILDSHQPRRDPWSEGTLNLTQHGRSEDQFKAGVVDIAVPEYKDELHKLLTFESIPAKGEIEKRAREIAELACDVGHYSEVMIGGASYLMCALEKALSERGIQPLHAFSKRVSEEKEVDGKVIKTHVFKHLGFVEVSA